MSEKSYTPTYYGTNSLGNDYVCFEDGAGKPGYSYSNLNGSEYSKYPDGGSTYVNPVGQTYSTPASGGSIDSSTAAGGSIADSSTPEK